MANINLDLVDEILNTKNYRGLDRELVERLVIQMSVKYKEKQLVKEVKNKLHQVWGAFYESKPNFDKVFEFIKESKELNLTPSDIFEKTLLLHSSINERTSILNEFWGEIFQEFGDDLKIVDYGCGLNALGLLSINMPQNIEYKGFDIDQAQSEFLNKVFNLFEIYPKFMVDTVDIFNQKMNTDGTAFFLKLFPTLEQQQKGITAKILKSIINKQIVVSFPTKSLSRRTRNMLEFYSTWFESLIVDFDFETKKIVFENELVYILRRA